MTKLILLLPILLFFSYAIFSQNLEQKYGIYSYSKVLEFEGKDSTQLSELVIKWFEETKDYSVSLDNEAQNISADVIKSNTSFYGKNYSKLKFACEVSVKDNKIKVDIDHLLIGDVDGKTVSVSETLYSSRNNKESTTRKALQMKQDLNKYIEEFLEKTSSYIKHDGQLEKDRW